jgi:hypothetical protein
MGLMTSLAIGAALGGGLLAGKKLAGRDKQQQQNQTQPPVTAPPPGQLDASIPQPPMTDTAANQAAAVNAGNRQRKKALAPACGCRSLALSNPQPDPRRWSVTDGRLLR